MNICKEIGCTANSVKDLEAMSSSFKAGICSRPCDEAVIDERHSQCCYICTNLNSKCIISCRENELAILIKANKIRNYMNKNKRGSINANIS